MKSGFTDPLFDSLLTLQTAEWFMKARRNAGKPLLLQELKRQTLLKVIVCVCLFSSTA